MFKNKWWKYSAYAGFWFLIGMFFVFQQYIYNASNQNPFNWENNLAYRPPAYLWWAVLTPVIIYVVRKQNFERKKIFQTVFLLIIISLVVSFIHRFISISSAFAIRLFLLDQEGSFIESLERARFAIIGGTLDSMLMFWTIYAVVAGLSYYKKMKSQQLRASQLETKLAQAELEALKMQLQPHFLFNTLHSISTLMHRDTETADKMISRLSDLLRLSLDNIGLQKVPLRKELEFLEMYLEIQKIRFTDRLEVEFYIDELTYDIEVPNLLLQPLVENSIKYALEPSSANLKISILSKRVNNRLSLSIEDTGPGLDEKFKEGVGLSNTRARLEQLYGDKFVFDLVNNNNGLKVKIELPINEED